MKKLIVVQAIGVIVSVGVFATVFYLTKDTATTTAAVAVAVAVVAAAFAALAAFAFAEDLKIRKSAVVISALSQMTLIGLGFYLVTILL